MGKSDGSVWLQLTSVAVQIGVTIFVLSWIGKKLDAYFLTDRPWFAVSLSVVGMLASIYLLLKTVNKINKNEK